MKKGKVTDFILCMGALVVGATVALLAALKVVETNTALVFLGLSVACIGMSLIDFESPTKARNVTKKSKK